MHQRNLYLDMKVPVSLSAAMFPSEAAWLPRVSHLSNLQYTDSNNTFWNSLIFDLGRLSKKKCIWWCDVMWCNYMSIYLKSLLQYFSFSRENSSMVPDLPAHPNELSLSYIKVILYMTDHYDFMRPVHPCVWNRISDNSREEWPFSCFAFCSCSSFHSRSTYSNTFRVRMCRGSGSFPHRHRWVRSHAECLSLLEPYSYRVTILF